MKKSNIIVLAAASRTSGARTIYLQFLSHLKNNVYGNQYLIFVDECMPQQEIEGVTYCVVDCRSWIKRIWFDFFKLRKILIKKNIIPSLIISLQNTGARCMRYLPQIIYYHQPLPIYPNKWSLLKKDERVLALYKYFYPFFVRISFDKNKVDFITQIPYIKNGVIEHFGIPQDHVHVLFPDVEKMDYSVVGEYEFEKGNYDFVYPAVDAKYKGHDLLIESIAYLYEICPEIAKSVKIHLTLEKGQNRYISKKIEKYNVSESFVFHGVISHEQLLSMLNSSCGLLFPSKIETLGLPLLEAASLGKRIFVSDLEYAHQVIGSYNGAIFISADSEKEWAFAILKYCNEGKSIFEPYSLPQKSSWEVFFNMVNKK